MHRGDCLEIMCSLHDASIDMVFTDPPYGHKNNDGDLIHNWEKTTTKRVAKNHRNSTPRPIANDGLNEASRLYKGMLKHAARLLRSECCCCCCCGGGGGPDPQFARWSLWMDRILYFKQMVIFDKGPMGLGWHYKRSYECILIAQKSKGKCHWYDTSSRVENIIRPGDYGIRKIIPNRNEHPTAKPIALAKHFIKLHTQPGDWVLDMFMGSGSTGVACMETGRNFIGIELDKHWFEVAQKRIETARRRFLQGFFGRQLLKQEQRDVPKRTP